MLSAINKRCQGVSHSWRDKCNIPKSLKKRLLWIQIIQLFQSFYSPKLTFLHSKSCHEETFIFLAPPFHIVQVGENLNLKTSVVILGTFLNIGSKTNMEGHFFPKISRSWAVMYFSRLHIEKGTWEKGAHNEKADQTQLHKEEDMSKNWSPAPEGSSHTCKELNTVEGVQWKATEMTKELDHLTYEDKVTEVWLSKAQREVLSINSRHFKKYFDHYHWDFNILVQVSWTTTQEKLTPFPLHPAPHIMLLLPGMLAQIHWLQKGLGNRAYTTCQAKTNVGREKQQMKILPYIPGISCPISAYLNIYPNSCNPLCNKLSLKRMFKLKASIWAWHIYATLLSRY